MGTRRVGFLTPRRLRVAGFAVKEGPQPFLPILVMIHPVTANHWWTMPDMLVVSAFQLCHPKAFLILMKP